MSRTSLPLTAIAVAALAGGASAQDTLFTGGIDDDWFKAANWDLGAVPGATNRVDIVGGFDVTALAADAGGMTITTGELRISYDAGGAANSLLSEVDILATDEVEIGAAREVPGLSQGTLILVGASLTCDAPTGEDLEVGYTSDQFSENGSTMGHGVLDVTNGSVIGFGEVEVGYIFQQGGDATGSITIVNGDLIGDPDDTSKEITIAYNSQNPPGNTVGSVYVENGSVRTYSDIEMTTLSGPGTATGSFTLVDAQGIFSRGEFDVIRLAPGVQEPGSSALLDLQRSYFIGGSGLWGDLATVRLSVDGTTRAAEDAVGAGTYSAIDLVDCDIVDTTLEVEFTFTPSAGDSFDLIRLDQGNVFTGTLFDAITVTGLAQPFTTAIIPGDATAGEIIRLTIVPAPACEGDVDGDGDTDVFDFADLAANFGAGPDATREQGDITGDGFVDVFDFADLAADFGCGSE